MSISDRSHLISAILAASVALAAPTAYAVPGIGDAGGSPQRAVAADHGLPLPTLIPPANDDFDTPAVVSGLPYAAAQNTAEATTAPDDPWPIECLENAGTVWYAYVTPFTTRVTADASGSDYNTCLSVFTGARGSLVHVASNEDGGVTFLAEGGVTYSFMVAGYPGGGNLQFSLDVAPPLPVLPVRATRAHEARPSAGPDHLAWAHASRSSRFWTLYVQRRGEARERANSRRTDGYSGGFAGRTFVYQEVRGRQSNLRLLDLVNGRRSAPPAGVNTRHWEWHPTISGEWLLFARHNFSTSTDLIILRNRTTGRSVVLDRLATTSRRFAESGQVNGNYAVWYRCTPGCNVSRRDIAARTTTRIPNPNGWQQYDPSVTSDGTVYFLRSRSGCGNDVSLFRHPLAGARKALARLGPGRDSFHTFVLEHGDGRTSVFFDRVRCSNGAWDVLEVVDP